MPRRGRQSINGNLIKTTVFFFLESEVCSGSMKSLSLCEVTYLGHKSKSHFKLLCFVNNMCRLTVK